MTVSNATLSDGTSLVKKSVSSYKPTPVKVDEETSSYNVAISNSYSIYDKKYTDFNITVILIKVLDVH